MLTAKYALNCAVRCIPLL